MPFFMKLIIYFFYISFWMENDFKVDGGRRRKRWDSFFGFLFSSFFAGVGCGVGSRNLFVCGVLLLILLVFFGGVVFRRPPPPHRGEGGLRRSVVAQITKKWNM